MVVIFELVENVDGDDATEGLKVSNTSARVSCHHRISRWRFGRLGGERYLTPAKLHLNGHGMPGGGGEFGMR